MSQGFQKKKKNGFKNSKTENKLLQKENPLSRNNKPKKSSPKKYCGTKYPYQNSFRDSKRNIVMF